LLSLALGVYVLVVPAAIEIYLPTERTSEPELEILAMKLGCVLVGLCSTESLLPEVVLTTSVAGDIVSSLFEYTALLYDHYPLNNYPQNSEFVVQAYQLGALGLTKKSLVDCWMMGKLKQDLLMIVKKQLVLEMLVNESLEMIVDESLDVIVDESLMVEDKSLENLVNESLMVED
ncbi:hypothetical protein Tco_1270093, partial [Tanacetum coccineum]